ncbi:MAG: heavy metal translocating P-type ATPase [Planctomycetota bacterium]|nr:MAG: heavy metal translocating P-type ATPase [Planctomycetota bacterium]
MSRETTCTHCGLPVPGSGDKDDPRTTHFCCLGCRLAWQVAGADGEEGQARWVHARFLLAALFSVAVMMISLILYSEEIFDSGLEASALGQLFRWALLMLSAPVLLLLAPSLVDPSSHGWRRLASLDLWILVAVGAAWILSFVRVLIGSGALYFESASMVLVLVTLGRYLDARAKVRVGEAAGALRKLLPETAQWVTGESVQAVPVDQIRPGQVVRVAAGERAPVDGHIHRGQAACDLSAVNGESEPRSLGPGDPVPAGAVVVDGSLDLQVTAGTGHRLLDRVAESLQEARSRRTPSMRTADHLAGVLLPAVLALAAAVVVWQGTQGHWDTGIVRALAVLLVSCPCSLGIATPLATWSSIGEALRHGVLIRDAGVFEILPKVRTFLFDKTGTLTMNRRSLEEVILEDPGADPEGIRDFAAGLAAASSHPASRALAGDHAPALPDAFQTFPGRGIGGRVEGQEAWLGNRRLMEEQGLALSPTLEAKWRQAEEAGRSVLALGRQSSAGNRVEALFLLQESLRPNTAELLAQLQQDGASCSILTGDTAAAAGRLGERLQVPVQGNLMPQDKERLVAQKSADQGPVLFLGDGVNDGPALARADVSASLGGATEVARAAADMIFLSEDLLVVLEMQELARNTRRRIRFNLAWALSYNPLFLYLASTGRLSPVACAVAMALSSLIVVLVSLARSPATGTGGQEEESAWKHTSTPSYSAS